MGIVEDTYPLTSSGHVVFAEVKVVSVALKVLLAGLYSSGAQVTDRVSVGYTMRQAIEFLSRGVDGDFPTRFLLLQTFNLHTVIFNNAWRSQGWFEMAFPLTKRLSGRDVYFLVQPNTVKKVENQIRGQYGGLQLILMAAGDIERSISLVNDSGRWVFTTQGKPEAFENLDQYHATKKQERFSKDLLTTYLAAMNLFPFRDDFYVIDEGRPAVGIEIAITSQLEPRFPPICLKELREKYGPFQ